MLSHRAFASVWVITLGSIAPLAQAAGVVTVNLPWVRPAAIHAATEAYMEITSSENAVIAAAQSPAASRVTIRSTGPGRNASEIQLPAKTTVVLAPRRQRVVLSGLTQPLKLGDHVPITLSLKDANGAVQEIAVQAEVRTGSARDQEGHEHSH